MTYHSRRNVLRLTIGAAALPALSPYAFALDYPTRLVRLIVGFPAGGPTDVAARVIGNWLSERLEQPFVVENRPGAASNIATELVARAPADGYTLLVVSAPAAINTTLYDNLKFNVVHDIAPIAGIVSVPEVMVINPSVPANTVPEFIAYAKANPGKLNLATGGPGTVPDVAGELFQLMTGVDLVHVGYRGGGPALIDLIGGRVQVMFETTLVTAAHIKAGQLRALAVTSVTPLSMLPDVPTLAEFVPGYEATAWFGLGAPRDTPGDIIDKLNREVNACLADPGVSGKLADLGGSTMIMRADEFGALIVGEAAKWGKVIRARKLKPE
jgi:tripartite-type tricarboxylate transporter receptor subunit TctC